MKVYSMRGSVEQVGREQKCSAFVLPSCKIGLEFEWEHVNKYVGIHTAQHPSLLYAELVKELDSYYANHRDGSLRGVATEFTFRGPYFGTRLLRAVEVMEEASRVFEFRSSYRTSLHVHLDVNDLDFPDDLHTFSGVYALAEPLLYKYVRRARDTCNYCIPWYLNLGHVRAWQGALKIGNAPPRREDAPHRFLLDVDGIPPRRTSIATALINSKVFKYAGMNFFSLGDLGSLEFRMAPVDMQLAKIVSWINIIMCMKRFVLNSRTNLDQFARRVYREGPADVLRSVFQEKYEDLVRMTTTLQEDLLVGSKTLTQVLIEASGE